MVSAKVTSMVTNNYITMNGNGNGFSKMEEEFIKRHHKFEVKENQCSSSLVKHIKAPIHLVWSLVRRFDQPQKYKPFVSRCVVQGDLRIGSVREVNVKSGLPATTSTERLEYLDDDEHILGMTIVGGDHRLKNYSSIVTVHPEVIDEDQEPLRCVVLMIADRLSSILGLQQISKMKKQFRNFLGLFSV
ncbi:hypothetical protein V6N12_044073 [Hibiscus sabdariffa]|uniref:Uncharacterized protein n=1 Tax=Hibiscus sabdariffa TaxID=183260 RepID=A0ABR2DG86_9ROSI